MLVVLKLQSYTRSQKPKPEAPQTIELIKTFSQRCAQIVVTDDRSRADYIVRFDRESFKNLIRKRDKMAVFRRDGDVVFSESVRSVGNAVQDACRAINIQ